MNSYNLIQHVRKKYPNLVHLINNHLIYPYRNIVTELKCKNNHSNIHSFIYKEKKINFFLPYKYDLIEQTIISKNTFFEIGELHIIKTYIKQNAVVLDIGANIGNHLIFFAKYCNISKIIGFEPNPIIFPILEKNVILNDLSDLAELHQIALGSKKENGIFLNEFSPTHLSYTNRMIKIENSGNIGIYPLDSIIHHNVDFIKIDVEGMELEVLKGALSLIRSHKPVIFIETEEISEVMDYLSRFEYKIKRELANNNYLLISANVDSN